eukprot:TRINITY_DN58772_c0_g1_i1.p1 TRINITY_DN58772_c0_g1~~TRINITY_DN58772_c0_g1_i1.p1  ORF type:complete len:117 (+),score=33.01 TRINITY_DN58772_c0_g1_i1:85-435(+)
MWQGLAFVVLVAASWTQAQSANADDMMKRADVNKDGKASREEVVNYMEMMFGPRTDDMEASKADEARAFMSKILQFTVLTFHEVDEDRDGFLTSSELTELDDKLMLKVAEHIGKEL